MAWFGRKNKNNSEETPGAVSPAPATPSAAPSSMDSLAPGPSNGPHPVTELNARPESATLSLGFPGTEEERTELTNQIWDWIIRGRDDADEFIEIYAEDHPTFTEDQIENAFEELTLARRTQQRGFGSHVESRLTQAFELLNQHGIVARADFSCCGNCASGEIWDERDDSRHWKGYVYFHQQDTDSLVESHEVYIGYGAFPPENFDEEAYGQLSEDERVAAYEKDTAAILHQEVFPVLEQFGITPEWNGNLNTRVLLKNADWYAPLD